MSDKFNEAGIDVSRHTAIRCTHQTDIIRERMREAFEQSSLMPLLSLRYPHGGELDDIIGFMVSIATAEATKIMWEHSGETAAEYRQILKETRR